MPDARKRLTQLRQEWSSCTQCSLGVRRASVGGKFVFGEGEKKGIMFIGEGPGGTEEEEGRPFVGPSGTLLRDILTRVGVTNFYITNLVTCRSCSPVLDEMGQPRLSYPKRGVPGKPLYKDEPPLPSQIELCKPRLHEEIYIVDPVLIVTLGGSAAEAVLGKKFTITSDRGRPVSAFIPGATYRPVVTKKNKTWARMKGNQLEMPIAVTQVEYLVIPTLHPAYVIRKRADRSFSSPLRQLVTDIQLAMRTYERYMQEVHGTIPAASPEIALSDFALEDPDDHG